VSIFVKIISYIEREGHEGKKEGSHGGDEDR
jgi:hypothetical protein